MMVSDTYKLKLLQSKHDELLAAFEDVHQRLTALEAENEKLRAAGEKVVNWWLSEGAKHFDGAPNALFALRHALEGERAAAKALN